MPSLLKDPLVHFLVLGACLFVFFFWRGDADDQPQRIRISAEQVAQLRQAATLLQGRAPSDQELEELIEPTIREEILYREALALGLDENDDEVRTRLVEKMQYLTQDLADPEPASEQELREFFDASPDLFRVPELVTFDQIFFSPMQRGNDLDTDVAAAIEQLVGGHDGSGLGDRTPLQDQFVGAPRERVDVLFGTALTDAVFTMQPGVWSGPYESDFGWHVVRLVERTQALQPAFEAVREQALQLFAEQRRRQANEAGYAEIRARYDIIVDWPDIDLNETPR